MISFKSQTESLAEQLKTLIETKEEKYKSTLSILNSWKDLNDFLNGLRSSMKKMQSVLIAEQKEIQELKTKLKQLTFVKVVDTTSPSSGNKLVSLIEIQSIITEKNNSKLDDPMKSITDYLGKMLIFVEKRLKNKWLPAKINRKYSENMVMPIQMTSQRRNAKNNKLKHVHTFCKKDFDESKLGKSNVLAEALEILDQANKQCPACNKSSSPLLKLDCCGKICARCLKKKIIDYDSKVILNPFEADKKQLGMCICPTHNVVLNTKILLQIFTQNELQKMAVDALKRRGNFKQRMEYPNICANCKGVMNDDWKAVAVCGKHKICGNCCL